MKKNRKNQLKFIALPLALIGVLWLLFAGQGQTTRVVKIAPTPTRDYSKEWAAAEEYVRRLPASTPKLKPKAAQKKPKKGKKMAIKIARGTTGQADSLGDFVVESGASGPSPRGYNVYNADRSFNASWGTFPSSPDDPAYQTGLRLTRSGVVDIPASMPLGIYAGEILISRTDAGAAAGNSLYTTSKFQFEVVCMTVGIDAVEVVNNDGSHTWTLTGAHQGGTAPYTDTFTKTGDGTFSGNALTLSPGQSATVTLNSGDSSNPACTATASRNFSGGATTVGFQRWRCTNGNCESYFAGTADEGFETFQACVDSGCGAPPPPASGRYVCVNGECVYQSTTQAPYGFATLAECQASGCGGTSPPGGENTDASGCCLPGFYREVAGGPCIPVPATSEPSVPAIPSAPTLAKNCTAQTITLTPPVFPAQATRIEIEREGVAGIFHTFEAPATFLVADASLVRMRFRASACNALGCSAFGAWSAPASLASEIVPVWISPAPGAVAGMVQLVADAGARNLLHATEPLLIRAFGGELPLTYDAISNRFSAQFDSAMQYQGDLSIELQARDLAGCYSAIVPLALTLDNSLERGERWSETALDAGESATILARGEVLSHVALAAKIIEGGAVDMLRFFRWWVKSPDPGAATLAQLADTTFMASRVASWQDAPVNDVARLITPATPGPNSPDHTARLCLQSLPCEAMNLYDLSAASIIKMRQTQDDEVEILTNAAYFKFTAGGLETLATFADFDDTGVVTDGARIGDKIYLAHDGSYRVIALDLVTEKISAALYPFLETRFVSALENWNGTLLALYANAGTTTGYSYKNGDWDDPFAYDGRIERAWVRGGGLFLASDGGLLSVAADGALTTLAQHTAPVSAFQKFTLETGDETEFGDESGAAFELDGATALPLASGLGGAVADLERFQGAGNTRRGALIVADGANAGRVFLKNAGFYEPRWSLADLQGNPATRGVALARQLITLRAPSGDPLKGGDAGLFSESLLVAFETSAGAFLARIQEAAVDLTKTKKGREVGRENFKRARTVKAPLAT